MRSLGLHPAVVAAITLLAIASAAWGQEQGDDGGPLVVGEPREKLEALTFDRLNFFLDFYTRYQRDEIDRSEGPDTTDTQWLVRGTLGMSTRAFIGHRNLVDVTADVRLGWQNESIDSESEGIDGDDTSFVDFFNVRALVFGAGPAPLTVWAVRDETQLDRAFAGSIDSLLEEYGASVRLFQETAPTTLRYFYRRQQYDDQLGFVDDDITQNTFSFQSQWIPDQSQRLLVDYAFDMIDESRVRGFENEFDRHDATITHDFNFGSEYQHTLRTTGRLLAETGDRENSLLRLNELLTMRHSERLDSRYTVTVENRSVQDQDLFLARGSAQVTHRLFESLITTATVGGSHSRLSDENFTSDQIFGRVEWTYTKAVPLGQFDATLALGFDYRDDSERGDTVMILDRPGVFNDPFPIVLGQRNIEEMSILVKNTSGTREFVEGRDYTIRAFPDRVELRRLVGGQISDGEAVLLDFDIGPQPAAQTTSLLAAISGRYSIREGFARGLSVYGEFRDTSQNLETDDPLLSPNDVRVIRAGSEYRRGPFTVGAEYESQDTDLSPFDAIRAWARYDQRFGPRSAVSINATYDRFEFTDDSDTTELIRVLGEWRQGLATGLDFRLRLLFRDEQSDFSGSSQGFEQALELNWINRQTRIFASVRNSMLFGDVEDSNSQTFAFGLRREF